jgi:D-alanine-D-alanine ligase
MTRKRKLRVGVLFGGRSGEHEVSLRSARFVLDSLDPEKYDVRPIGITKAGEWLLEDDPMPLLEGAVERGTPPAQAPVSLPIRTQDQPAGSLDTPLDVVFPVMHGTYGEDGTIQGLLELADVAYVGSGVTGSAVGMDKAIQKRVLHAHGIPVAPSRVFARRAWRADPDSIRTEIEAELEYPVFTKPCNLGSSVGIRKAHNADELGPAMDLAASYDRRLIVEACIPHAREIEVSVLGNDEPEASVCGEIIPGNEFYDYNAKYLDDTSQECIPADIPHELAARIRRMAVEAFRVIDCSGFARVDFLVNGETLDVVLNEINTIPGFTEISQFPKLWRASGVDSRTLLDRLIDLALERHTDRRETSTSYD